MKLSKEQINALPSWADFDGERVNVNPVICYSELINELNLEKDQFGAEVARRCMTKLLTEITGPDLLIRIIKTEGSDEWAIINLPEGKGAALGVAQFRQYFLRLKESKYLLTDK